MTTMIYATGIDIVQLDRLRHSIERFGQSFLDKVYTPAEQCHAPHAESVRITYFAGRWAIKEALSKALGTGITEHCRLLDIETLNDDNGKPYLTLSGPAKETADHLGIHAFHISISHELDYAVGLVIAETP